MYPSCVHSYAVCACISVRVDMYVLVCLIHNSFSKDTVNMCVDFGMCEYLLAQPRMTSVDDPSNSWEIRAEFRICAQSFSALRSLL